MARVLVADDSIKDALPLVIRLTELGHDVTYSGYSQEAQKIIRCEKIDCAVFDGYLPRYPDRLNPSEEWGGAFLAREAKRLSPNFRCAVYTHGLGEKHLNDLTEMHVKVFLKGTDSIDDVISTIGIKI